MLAQSKALDSGSKRAGMTGFRRLLKVLAQRLNTPEASVINKDDIETVQNTICNNHQ
jgi:hypothetical protein